MKLEVLQKKAGDAGPAQLMLFVLIGLVNVYTGVQNMMINFLAPEHAHWCAVPELEDLPDDLQKRLAIPWDEEHDAYSSCLQYDVSAYNWSTVARMYHHDDISGMEAMLNSDVIANASVRGCDNGWNYDTSVFHSTVISEWELVCGSDGVLEVISPLFTTGLLVGSLVGGMVSDSVGRMSSLFVFTLLHLLAGVAASFSINVYMFMTSRFLIAVSIRGAGISGAVLLMESLSSRFRVAAVVGYQMFLGLGIVFISALALLLRDFRQLQLFAVAPLVGMLAYKWILPESPSYLLSRGRLDDLVKGLQKVSVLNRRIVSQEDFQDFKKMNTMSQNIDSRSTENKTKPRDDSKLSFVDLFRHPVLRRYTLTSYILMTTCLFIDLGVALNVSTLFGDVYTNAFLTGASEMAANFLVFFGLQLAGRRPSLITCFLGIIGTESVSIAMTLIDHRLISSIMSIMSRCLASSGYLTLSIYVAELYPTSIRQAALGSANAIGAAIAIAAPLVGGVLPEIWPGLPNIIYGGLALIGAPLCLLLPETRGHDLPETLTHSVNLLQASGPSKESNNDDVPTVSRLCSDADPSLSAKTRLPARHTSDLERGVFDDDGNLLYKENASLSSLAFTNVVCIEDEFMRPSGMHRAPVMMEDETKRPSGMYRVPVLMNNNDGCIIITHL